MTLPDPLDWDPITETADEYRRRLRAWFDSVPDDPQGATGFAVAEWEQICSLMGLEPYGPGVSRP